MKLVFATHNKHKFEEVRAMLPKNLELLSLEDIGCFEEIPETADTIEGNAILKAQYVKDNFGFDCFADDTGLEVKSLNNEPGVYSARYAGIPANSQANIDKLLFNLKEKEDRKARFKTAIVLIFENKETMFLGICKGEICRQPKGESGFGYDPVFIPEGFEVTFAEMSLQQKGKLSHRGRAMQQLVDFLSV